MPPFPTHLSDWFRAHHGVVATEALVRLEVSRSTLRALIASDVVEPVHEGVYRLRAWPDTLESRCAAVCAADPNLVITCATAGRLWGLRTCAGDEVHVAFTGTTRPVEGAGIVLHRTTWLPRTQVVRRADGIRLTNAARLVFDESRHRGALALESLVEAAIDDGRCTAQTLHEVGNALRGRGRPGSALFTEVMTGRPVWRRPADSHPEIVLRLALASAGVHLDTQVPLALPDGRTIHPDLGDAAVRFYIEVDDPTWHGGRVRAARDFGRDRQARIGGAQVERVSTDEIANDLDAVVADLAATYRLRVRQMTGRAA